MSIEEVCSFRKESLVPQVDESTEDNEAPKGRLITILDDIESRVERFRRGALLMEEEKDLLFSSIDAVRNSELLNDLVENDKEEIMHYTERVSSRCGTVEIHVRTVRNQMQEESLNQVNTFIDNLVVDLHNDPFVVRDRCISYMAACGSRPEENIDKGFEVAVLGCSLDDQKRVRRRLQGLLNYIEYSHKVKTVDD